MPPDTSAIPALLGSLKAQQERLSRTFTLVRTAAGPDETIRAMQALLLELAKTDAALHRVAEFYNLPLAELVASGFNPLLATMEHMERFIPLVIEGETS